MPAFNAAKTLLKTYEELPHEYVDETILVDYASKDDTQQSTYPHLCISTYDSDIRVS